MYLRSRELQFIKWNFL